MVKIFGGGKHTPHSNFWGAMVSLPPGSATPAIRFRRQKLPFICNQRRGTLPVRIAWKGDWTLGVLLQYEGANCQLEFEKIFLAPPKFLNF